MTNYADSEQAVQAPIPWEGVQSLARHWAGSGSLFDWLAPADWDITRKWSADTTRARASYVLLLQLASSVLPRLPRHAGEWMDLLEQEIHRSSEFAVLPSAHTDWPATLSEFGRYPSPLYVERLPRGSFDTPPTRALKWLCGAVLRAEQHVERTLRQRPLDSRLRARLLSALDLPEVQGAADVAAVEGSDIATITSLGGVWSLIGRTVSQFNVLSRGNFQSQLDLLSRAPILPAELRGALFEVGVLGVAATAVREAFPTAAWLTRTALAAAESGVPCLTAELDEGECNFYYQTVPQIYRTADGPYRRLTNPLGGGPLRPDIWLVLETPSGRVEMVLECKYSLDRSYVSSGVVEILAYSREYPVEPTSDRVLMAICPDSVMASPRSWSGELALGTPNDLHSLVSYVCEGRAAGLLARWA